jgi:hypothetical protein
MLTWRWFFGASILAVGLLLKMGAPIVSIIAGVAIAALFTWKMGSDR